MKGSETLPIIEFATQQDWEAWLAEHYSDPTGIWLKIAKKATGFLSISYVEALEGALCYGWIDGQRAAFDEQYWLQKFTPRRAKSIWSQINCDKVASLIEAGRIQPGWPASGRTGKGGWSLGGRLRRSKQGDRAR